MKESSLISVFDKNYLMHGDMCPGMHANEIHKLYIDITKCPLTLILTKTHKILSNMKSYMYENNKKACFI